jgi:hypothetical protein
MGDRWRRFKVHTIPADAAGGAPGRGIASELEPDAPECRVRPSINGIDLGRSVTIA